MSPHDPHHCLPLSLLLLVSDGADFYPFYSVAMICMFAALRAALVTDSGACVPHALQYTPCRTAAHIMPSSPGL